MNSYIIHYIQDDHSSCVEENVAQVLAKTTYILWHSSKQTKLH